MSNIKEETHTHIHAEKEVEEHEMEKHTQQEHGLIRLLHWIKKKTILLMVLFIYSLLTLYLVNWYIVETNQSMLSIQEKIAIIIGSMVLFLLIFVLYTQLVYLVKKLIVYYIKTYKNTLPTLTNHGYGYLHVTEEEYIQYAKIKRKLDGIPTCELFLIASAIFSMCAIGGGIWLTLNMFDSIQKYEIVYFCLISISVALVSLLAYQRLIERLQEPISVEQLQARYYNRKAKEKKQLTDWEKNTEEQRKLAEE